MRCTPRNAIGRKKAGGGRHPRRNPVTGAGQYADRDRHHDFSPVLPFVKLRQIVSAHKPDKIHPGIVSAQRCQCLCRVPRSQPCLYIGNCHTGMLHHRARLLHPLREWCRPLRFKWISRRHQPPHPIQSKAFQRFGCDVDMTVMRRIKRPAQQANTLAARCFWKLRIQNGPRHCVRGR